MSAAATSPSLTGADPAEGLIGEAAPSQAGPLDGEAFATQSPSAVRLPPAVQLPPVVQSLRLISRQSDFVFRAARKLGDTFMARVATGEGLVFTSHPDHARSLFTADPDLAPSMTAESPLAPIVGDRSVLTLLGPEHMRQRKLLLPRFHGAAVERYTAMIAEVAEREIDSWPLGEPFALAPAMQAITLEVILSGIFGVQGVPAPGTPERDLRDAIRRAVRVAGSPLGQALELLNVGRNEPPRVSMWFVESLERPVYAAIAARRAAGEAGQSGEDVFSLLLASRYEDGEPMSDKELRDELITLVLAGHETTAHSLAWAFERLLRTPRAYDRLREEVRAGGGDDYIEATIHEAMRARPVIPIVGRRVSVPWQLGRFRVPAATPILLSILLLHHRGDLYPRPAEFRPERFLGVKPGTYTWIPFGGGIRRCLGATLAMAEQRVVLRAVARRTDLEAVDPAPERPRHRNVTMIPAHGARAILRART
jgi:cytochrome P450